jgi:hypothetical protein
MLLVLLQNLPGRIEAIHGTNEDNRCIELVTLQAIVFVCYCVFVCIYIGILAPLACFGL